ncbi:unannotated protein [freshwater metagenome]|uniref:Unannotated protein n=1 Tax=freshwater metagenome TaxID=449393 RepID=A0A6J6QQY5_9ZZZZ
MVDPPFPAAVNSTRKPPSIGSRSTELGVSGTVTGVALTAEDDALAPVELTARSSTEAAVPFVSPVITKRVEVPRVNPLPEVRSVHVPPLTWY